MIRRESDARSRINAVGFIHVSERSDISQHSKHTKGIG